MSPAACLARASLDPTSSPAFGSAASWRASSSRTSRLADSPPARCPWSGGRQGASQTLLYQCHWRARCLSTFHLGLSCVSCRAHNKSAPSFMHVSPSGDAAAAEGPLQVRPCDLLIVCIYRRPAVARHTATRLCAASLNVLVAACLWLALQPSCAKWSMPRGFHVPATTPWRQA